MERFMSGSSTLDTGEFIAKGSSREGGCERLSARGSSMDEAGECALFSSILVFWVEGSVATGG